MWRTSFVISQEHVDVFMTAFEDSVDSVSAFALGNPGTFDASTRWQIDLLTSDRPDNSKTGEVIARITSRLSISAPNFTAKELRSRDWVADSEAALGPVNVGRFRVRGRHVPPSPKPEVYDIQVEASRAFGSGHHETTRGCLAAIERVARNKNPRRALDLGTGSGVLAIAIAMRMGIPVVAADVDPVAVAVAKENVRINGSATLIDTAVSDGVRNAASFGRYDLVVANILAGPLVRLVPAIDRLARPTSTIVLSGIVTRQEAALLAAYRRIGFSLVSRVVTGSWPTIILNRRGRTSGPKLWPTPAVGSVR